MSRPQAEPNPPSETVLPVRAMRVEFHDIQPTITLYGMVRAGREAEIRSQVAGRIVALDANFRSGQTIDAGAALASIDAFEYELAVREGAANAAETRARIGELRSAVAAERESLKLIEEQIDLRERDLTRVRRLLSKNQASEKAEDDAQLALNSARQERIRTRQSINSISAQIDQQGSLLERNLAQLDRAKRDLSDTQIVAPFSGYLQDVTVAMGKRVAVGENMATLVDPESLEVAFDIPNADYSRLVGAKANHGAQSTHPLIGTSVEIIWRLGANVYSYDGSIKRVGANVDSSSGGVRIYADLASEQTNILRPGAFVEVLFPDVRYAQVLELPEAALSDNGIIYSIVDERLVAHEVEVVREFGNRVFVRADIAAGTQIVAEQFSTIGPGQKVRPM